MMLGALAANEVYLGYFTTFVSSVINQDVFLGADWWLNCYSFGAIVCGYLNCLSVSNI